MQISSIFGWLVSIADLIIVTIVTVIGSIILIVVLFLFPLFGDDELYEIQVQQLIEKGYLNADYTQEELGNLCHTSYGDFEEDYTEACFWFL